MLSKNRIKQLRTYQQKKYRDSDNVFIVEGTKLVNEVLSEKFTIKTIVASQNWADTNSVANIEIATDDDLVKISLLKNHQQVWALVERPSTSLSELGLFAKSLILALDGVQDPGNMGTIIRTAEWFGIQRIICSEDCVDVYNPKVVQATMGAILRVEIIETDLSTYLKNCEFPVYGAFLEGENVYESSLQMPAVLVMGNEGNGISKEVETCINHKIHIPSAPVSKAESLNVATATSVLCSEFLRAQFK